MFSLRNITFSLLLILGFSSCSKTLEGLESNPNKANSVTPDLILGSVLTDVSGMGSVGALGGIASWGSVQKYNQYFLGAYAYYGDNQYDWSNGSFDSYTVLKNVIQMEQEARAEGLDSINPYEAIGKFVRAWYFYNLSSMMGDIPCSAALQGASNVTPNYDTQKKVFAYILNVLDTANTHFSTLIAHGNTAISSSTQDIFYAGDLTKWQKAVNAFKLRVLIALSNKTTDADLNVESQFAKVLNNSSSYPLFTSQKEDLKFTYVQTYNQYPLTVQNFGSTASRYAMAQTYVKTLTDLNDPRVFITCEPAWALVDSFGYSPTDMRAFVGESTGTSIATIEQKSSARLISFINRYRYYNTYTGDPDVLVGYKEMCFNIAEAINRGWISGDAESWYKKGIVASFSFYGIDTSLSSFKAYFLKSGDLTNIQSYNYTFNFNNYYAQSSVKYAGSNTVGLDQILLQKYIAMFQNSAWEAYFNYRRTGVPAFRNGTGVGNNGVVPLRWAYPTTEQTQNSVNYSAALIAQGFSSDDINGKMWLIK